MGVTTSIYCELCEETIDSCFNWYSLNSRPRAEGRALSDGTVLKVPVVTEPLLIDAEVDEKII